MIPDRHIEMWKWSQGEKLERTREALAETMAKITIEELLCEKWGRDALLAQSCPEEGSHPVEWVAVVFPRIGTADSASDIPSAIPQVICTFLAASVGELKNRMSSVWAKMEEMIDSIAQPGETIDEFAQRWLPPTVTDEDVKKILRR